jgi:hypothetical protein
MDKVSQKTDNRRSYVILILLVVKANSFCQDIGCKVTVMTFVYLKNDFHPPYHNVEYIQPTIALSNYSLIRCFL